MHTDYRVEPINTLASPISSKTILIMGGHKNRYGQEPKVFIYNAITNNVKPHSYPYWQGGQLDSFECDANQCGVTRNNEVVALVSNKLEELNLILYKPVPVSTAKIVVNYGKTYKNMASILKNKEFDLIYAKARAEEFG